MQKEVLNFFRFAEVANGKEIMDNTDGLVVHIDNQLYLIKIIQEHEQSPWGYFEVYQRKDGQWKLIAPPFVEVE
jgi:hypothetical protein